MKHSIQKTCFIILMFASFSCFAMQDPVLMVKRVANSMLADLKKNHATLQTNPGVVYKLARKNIVPHADLAQMAKRVLPPAIWNGSTAKEKSVFQKEFSTTLIRTYASALASYSDETITFFPVRGGTGGKSTVTVNSEIHHAEGPPVSVSYRLIASGGVWKLLDLSVEGVSMLESFRSQFAGELSRGNMSTLLQALKEHNDANSA